MEQLSLDADEELSLDADKEELSLDADGEELSFDADKEESCMLAGCRSEVLCLLSNEEVTEEVTYEN